MDAYKSIVVGLDSVIDRSEKDLVDIVRKIKARANRQNSLRVNEGNGETDILSLASQGVRDIEIYGLWIDGHVGYLAERAIRSGMNVRVPDNFALMSPKAGNYNLKKMIEREFRGNGTKVRITKNKGYTLFCPEKRELAYRT